MLSQSRSIHAAAIAAMWLLAARIALGQDASPPIAGSAFATQFHELDKSLRSFDWEMESKSLTESLQRVFERNGWNDEPQQFARDVAIKVAAIPPWDLNGRLQALTDAITDRYGLSTDSANRFKSTMFKATIGLMIRHSPVIISQTAEVVDTRKARNPFTAEQVARWSSQSGEMMKDAFQMAERLVKELEPEVAPAKRDQLKTDWDSFLVRQKTVESMMERWSKGEWDPAHWGMDTDPIQMQGLPPAKTEKEKPQTSTHGGGSESVAATVARKLHWGACDPSTWHMYVLHVQKTYKLDAAQFTSAESIHAEILQRARDHMKTRAGELAGINISLCTESAAYEPIRNLFDELQERLNSLPSSVQRETAEP